jgi:hypothetical protein
MKIVVITDHLTKQPCDREVPHERLYDRVPPSFGDIREKPLAKNRGGSERKEISRFLRKAAQKLF